MPKRPLIKPTDGTVRFDFVYQAAQKRLLRTVQRGGGTYLQLAARQCLEVGGIRSGKTVGKLIFFVQNYCLKFPNCDILILRRTFPELEAGVIQDFKTFIPKELYSWNQATHVATFVNGSRAVFASCVNNQIRDIEKYLGQSYPGILVDEAGQFSPDAWMLLYTRNLVNSSCREDEYGNLPIPSIAGCTNPIGPYWEFYHSLFVLQEPWEKEEGMKKGTDGSWWVAGDPPMLKYDPRNYACNHTTVRDNPAYQKRDPEFITRLNALPKAKRDKMLLGLMDKIDGQYFDCFTEEQNVIDLREDSEAVIWQDWQPVWCGQDFGVGHWNAIYFFTKALVRSSVDADYKAKTICFQEIAPEMTGYTNIQLADMIAAKACYPRLPQDHPQYERISGKRCKVSAIYFSHEKFSRVMEAHSPADEYSRLLRERGLPAVSRATMDRIGSASFMYNELKTGRLVILKNCSGIILAIPALQRDPDKLDDVLKVDAKADDRYDAFRYGLYGMLRDRQTPQIEHDRARAALIEDPFARHFYLRKKAADAAQVGTRFKQAEVPYWTVRN